MRFCGACGKPLPAACGSCGFENPAGFRFCGGCGGPISGAGATQPVRPASPAPGPSPAESQPLSSDGERRHITVVFCDLVGSTELSSRLDPEDLRIVIREYQAAAVEALEALGGFVAQYLGDGILAYFGYPVAHEDDSVRAIRAGLDLIEAVAARADAIERVHGVRPAVRVGIHAGPVVAGEMGAGGTRERLALGRTPNLAARLQDAAAPGTVVISQNLHGLVRDFFDCEDMGERRFKGIEAPQKVFRVLRPTDVRDRVELAASRGLSGLVGREAELALLQRHYTGAKEGRGQVVLIGAEAGLGKSRLSHALKHATASEPRTWLTCHCSAYHQSSALYPVIDMLSHQITVAPGPDGADRATKARRLLGRLGLESDENLALLAALLDLPLAPDIAPLAISRQKQHEKTLGLLLAMLLASARDNPMVLVVEDLHWVDPSTIELLDLVVKQGSTSGILALFTHRPSWQSVWMGRAHVASISLDRLTDLDVRRLVRELTGNRALPPEVMDQLLAKTDGVPLFVEELWKMIRESGLLVEREDRYELSGPLPPLAIPATLKDSLAARLDRLASDRDLLQLAALIGREFSFPMLAAASGRSEPEVAMLLGRLVEAEFLHQRGLPPDATYVFRHALIQDAAQESLLRSSRQAYHARIAHAMVERFPDLVANEPEIVARHFTEAGLAEQAVEHWLAAGQRAVSRWANAEAIVHLRKGLEVLATLPESPARHRTELAIQTTLASAYMATQGFGSEAARTAFDRASSLVEHAPDPESGLWLRVGMHAYYTSCADYPPSVQLAEATLGSSAAASDPRLRYLGHYMHVIPLFYEGSFGEARRHLDLAGELLDANPGLALIQPLGLDYAVISEHFLGMTAWIQGETAAGLARSVSASAGLGAGRTPFDLACSRLLEGHCLALARDIGSAATVLDEVVALSAQHGLFVGLHGAALGASCRVASMDDLAGARAALDHYRQAGLRDWLSLFLLEFAHACVRVGDLDGAEATLAESLAFVEATGQRFAEAELRRLSGDVALARGNREAARVFWSSAVEVARKQGARSFEQRAAARLAEHA